MYEPLAWTPSTTCWTGRSDRTIPVDVNGAHLLPSLDLFIGVDVRNMMVCPSCRVDGGSLGYQKRSGSRRTLCVIFDTHVGVDMVLGGSRAGERRKDDAVREGHSTDLERCEESRRLGEGRHFSAVGW